jgi:translation initiation factor eIF-2B subunit delta
MCKFAVQCRAKLEQNNFSAHFNEIAHGDDHNKVISSMVDRPTDKSPKHSFSLFLLRDRTPPNPYLISIHIVTEMPDPYAPEYLETLHPEVIELGMKYASGEIQGDNERCRSMMQVFLQALKDYAPPTAKSASTTNATSKSSNNNNNNSANDGDFRHHFDHQVLKPSFQFWTVKCRPHSVSMGNAFTFLKTAVASLERDISLEDAKDELEETIERYLQERLEYADRAIAQHALSKIHDGDILLTFGYTEAIDVLLRTAQEERIDFYVWVVDARPLTEGKRLLRSLREVGIPCGYIQLNALTYVMQQVTKVFLGASALLANGSIYGRIGTACVALLAKSHHVPVLVCCETYKISNKVQLESITQNELGNPYDLLLGNNNNSNKANGNSGDETTKSSKPKNLKAANLLYDVTSDKFVSGIITELGIIPPTSVAVLLREMNMANDRAY